MALQLELAHQEDILVVRATGIFASADEAAEYGAFILRSVRETKVLRVLLDEHELVDKTTALEASVVGETEPFLDMVGMGVRMACLYNPDFARQARAYETALQNRSVSYRAFDSREQAVTWLRS